MKKIIILFLILFTTKSFCQFQSENDIKTYKDLGYQFEMVYEYQTKFGEIDLTTKFLKEKSEFDKEGQIIKCESYHESEYSKEFEEVKTFFYDNNKLIKIVTYDINGVIKSITKNFYSGRKNTERRFYSSDGILISKTIYRFEESDYYTEYMSFDDKGNFKSRHQSEYNSDNELIKSTYFNIDNEISSYSKWKRKPNIEIYESFDEQDRLKTKHIRTLNEEGQTIELLNYFFSEVPTKTIYKYDNDGLITKKIHLGKNGEPIKIEKIERINHRE